MLPLLRPTATRSRLQRISAISASHHHRRPLTKTARSPIQDGSDFGNYHIILPAEPFVFGVSHIAPRRVPEGIIRPDYARPGFSAGDGGKIGNPVERVLLGGDAEARVRDAGKLARRALEYAKRLVEVGVTTNSIDKAVHEFITTHNAYPSPLGYMGFPKSCCTSVNNVLVHGIPDDRPLQDGDIINIDITVFLNGYHGDTSEMFLVGNVDEQGRELIEITHDALQAGIGACGPGRPFKSIGKAIHELIRHKDFSVSSQFTGHSIGTVFHKPPWILHHLNDEPGVMVPGDCFTIEPCLVQGSDPRAWIFPDGWTTSTENAARGAQAEHTVLITERGAEVLTCI